MQQAGVDGTLSSRNSVLVSGPFHLLFRKDPPLAHLVFELDGLF